MESSKCFISVFFIVVFFLNILALRCPARGGLVGGGGVIRRSIAKREPFCL